MLRATLFGSALATTLVVAGPAISAQQPQAPPPIVQPGAPGQPNKAISAERAADVSKVGYSPADVTFMQGMIGHHEQAVEMVSLLKTRTQSADMRKLGDRITISQEDEIKMMIGWLEKRGQAVPGDDEHAGHDAHELMPGMLTPAEMAKLAAAKGTEFDRLFLEGMIKHHGGAITMVADLFKTPGAAQDADMFSYASDIDADQRMEIDRMASMLNSLKELKK